MFGKDAHSFFKEVARQVKLATDDDFAYQSLYFGGSPEGEHGCCSQVLWGEKWCVRGGRLPSNTFLLLPLLISLTSHIFLIVLLLCFLFIFVCTIFLYCIVYYLYIVYYILYNNNIMFFGFCCCFLFISLFVHFLV